MPIVTAEFSVPSDEFVLGQILQTGDNVTIDLTQFVPIERTLVPYFWAETSDPDAFESAVRADNRVESLTVVDNGPERTLYQIEWTTEIDGVLAALRKHSLAGDDAMGTTKQCIVFFRTLRQSKTMCW